MKNENYKSEIGITGIGVVSSLGHGYRNFADSAIQSQSGLKTISVFNSLPYERKLAGEVNDSELNLYLPKKGKRYMDRSIKFVCAAANMALEDAKLEINDLNKHRIGVIGSTTFGNLKSISDFNVESLTAESPLWVNPMDFPKTTINSAASNISIIIGAMGYNTTLLGGYTSSMDVISHGLNMLRMNKLDAVLVCSVEDLNEQSFLHHNVLGCLAGSSVGNERIAPFDKSGSGYILGEGAVVFILERVNDVIDKDRQMRVKIKSIGQGFDSSPNYSYYNIPQPDRIASVIRKTLEKAELSPKDICLISTSANGCVEYDTSEAEALSKVFSGYEPSIVSIKSKIGETVSVGGAFATVLATAVIEQQKAPYILNLSEPVVPLNYVMEKPIDIEVENALVTSIDPCGNCMSMIISRK